MEPQVLDIATEMEQVNEQFPSHQTFLLVCGAYCNMTISSEHWESHVTSEKEGPSNVKSD